MELRNEMTNTCTMEEEFDMRAITFGDEVNLRTDSLRTGARQRIDGSVAAQVAFTTSIISLLFLLGGTVFVFMGEWKTAGGLLGGALGFNVCFYIYMIEYRAFGYGHSATLTIWPMWGWGATLNICAFGNIVAAMTQSMDLAKSTNLLVGGVAGQTEIATAAA